MRSGWKRACCSCFWWLAQAWGSEAAIQRLPAAQQAYMTAALGGLLARLSGVALERTPGLLPALIAGVGTRLDSPLPAIRFCHMQRHGWGRCFYVMRVHWFLQAAQHAHAASRVAGARHTLLVTTARLPLALR